MEFLNRTSLIIAVAWLTSSALATADETLHDIDLPGRGRLVLQGVLKSAQITVKVENDPPVKRTALIEVVKASVISSAGILGEATIAEGIHAQTEPGYHFVRFLSAKATPSHSVVAVVDRMEPKIVIFDHSAVPAVTRTGVFPKGVRISDELPVEGTLQWKAATPNQIALTVSSESKSVTKQFSLTTGSIIGP